MGQAATWAFTPPQPGAAACVASWDGVMTLTDTVGGAPLATYSGQALAGLAAPLAPFAAGAPAGNAAAYPTVTGQPQQAAPAKFYPSNPTGTSSATLVMMGLACTCTPTGSGIVAVTLTGSFWPATVVNLTLGGRYGTGAAPANGAAVTGTRWGGAADSGLRGGAVAGNSNATPFTLTDQVTLTPGTAYWFDAALSTGNTSDQVNLQNLVMTFQELPL